MGLYRKKKNGEPRGPWYFIKQFKGKKAQGCIGTINKRKAQELWEKKYLPSILDGSFWAPPVEPVVEPGVREIIEHYMRIMSPTQTITSQKRNQEISAYWLNFLGDCPVSEAGDKAAEYREKRLAGEIVYGKYKDPKKCRKPGHSTVKKELSFLRQVFNKAIDDWTKKWPVLKDLPNPVKKHLKGLKDYERERYVTHHEAQRLAAALTQSRQRYLREMVILGCQTGLRESNIAYLKVSQCDFNLGRINKAAMDMKNKEAFSVKMTSTVKKVLLRVIKERKRISPYVFVNPKGQPYTPNAVSIAFHRLCERAGIEDLRFHDLRHDFASHLINSGASSAQVQVAMHHKSPRMTARYSHLYPENRDVVDRIDGEGTAAILLGLQKTTTRLLPKRKKKKGSLS